MLDVLKVLVLPPASPFLLALTGWLLSRRWPRLGRALVGFAAGALYLLSTPLVAWQLLATLEPDAAWSGAGAGAIVVLAGDASPAPEYGEATVGDLTLERIRYAAWLQHRTGLPVLVSGGSLDPDREPLAVLMKEALEEEFRVPVRWVEPRSRNTFENAKESARLLTGGGIRRVLLVTHAWHMRRARVSFEAAGLEVVAAPTAFAEPLDLEPRAVLPSAHALRDSAKAFHEWIGWLWYELVYF